MTRLRACIPLLLLPVSHSLFAQINNGHTVACEPEFTPAPAGHVFIGRDIVKPDLPDAARISRIHITPLPIFDENNPSENNALFRLANRLNFLTQEWAIDQIILIDEDEPYNRRLLEESERMLRDMDFLFDADLRVVSVCNDEVEVEVITKDTWSLTPNIHFDRTGGDDTGGFSVRDTNILGTGKLLGIGYRSDIDRNYTELNYSDPNVFGTRIRGGLSLLDSNDGYLHHGQIGLPFYALDSRQSWHVSMMEEKREEPQFWRGERVSEVNYMINDFSVQGGMSKGLRNGKAVRWNLGYRYLEETFSPTNNLPPPLIDPQAIRLSYVFTEVEAIEDNFAIGYNLDQIYRTEDLHLGYYFYQQVGYSDRAIGADQDRLIINGLFMDTLYYDEKSLLRHELEWEGRYNLTTEKSEDLQVRWEGRLLHRITDRRSFYAAIEGIYSRNLRSHQQVVMGGLAGTRGYRNRFQVGERSLVLTFEQRYFTDLNLFNLIQVGTAMFMDVGSAWSPGQDNGTSEQVLTNVGVGLRLNSSKAASTSMAHIDFAIPMTNRSDPEVDSYLIAVNVKSAF